MALAQPSRATAIARLRRDYLDLKSDPEPYIWAEPLPSNFLKWHYVIKGCENTPFYGGYYHGALIFTSRFPIEPPLFYIYTPNGRFMVNISLCINIPNWNPTWTVRSLLTALLNFMLEIPPVAETHPIIFESLRSYAEKSLHFNLRNRTFCKLFPEICEEIREIIKQEFLPKSAENHATAASADNDTDKNVYKAGTDGDSGGDAMAGNHKITQSELFEQAKPSS